ncbi:replicative DNA helicase [Geminocystis sp. CENA526]|uniref:replicative DNA helicase n=1 Tax=Geminocystis sp. CENA526 TaxID=1355871 RepID=UPI003D6FA07C
MNDFTPDLATSSLPPQNIEAEEIILGSILFDPNAMGKIIDILPLEAFYVNAHRHIYEAARNLYFQGQPIDLMTVSTWLNDHNLLEKIGGTPKIIGLLDRTVSSANIERYVPLITDKYVRRLLITTAKEISELGYDTTQDLDTILDEAEQKIFKLTQARIQQGLVPISETLINTFTEIQNFQEKIALPGISTEFYDLDALTGGFQRSDLIIIAGRPAMGKCLVSTSEIVLNDGSLSSIETIYNHHQGQLLTLNQNWRFTITSPSNFVDDGIKPVWGITTKLGRYIETTLTHPFLTAKGWQPLANIKVGNKIAVPRKIDIFGQEIIPDFQVKLIAYFIGDGCLTHTSPLFTNSNPLLQEDFKEAISHFTGVKTRLETSQNTRTPSIYVSSDLEFIKIHRQLFAEKLKNILENCSFTQTKLAELLNINPSLISGWKTGEYMPSESTFNSLCRLLNVKPSDLLEVELNSISKNGKNLVTIWLENLGLWGKNAHEKTIPSIIFKLSKSLVSLFLNRLFATDGWVTILKTNQVALGYGTVNEKLARQIQHLLLRFGIITHLKLKKTKYNNSLKISWVLNITDSLSIKEFIENIGIFGKEERIKETREILTNKKYHSNCDLIPSEFWQEIIIAKGDKTWDNLAQETGITSLASFYHKKRNLSRQNLLKIAIVLNNLSLQNLANSEIYWDEIVSIEYQGEKQVYDLTIPETHNFVANDICVHNTSFALNIAANIAKHHDLAVAIFSLEMSREQLAMRLLSGEGKLESSRLKSGRITEQEMEPLMTAMGTLSELPIYIDDSGYLTVMQMRSEVRRLQAEKKGKLGLVLIDYLQLMQGSSDNRVQELSRITRSLKSLAREINAPIIALSQLSRAVEQRTNKRPMLSDLRESGCLSGDSLVTMADTGEEIPIKDLEGKSGFAVWAINTDTMKIERAIVSNAFCTGVKPVYRLTTELGRSIKATANHKFLHFDGWMRLDELQIGDRIALPRFIPSTELPTMGDDELALLGHLIGDGCTLPRHAIQYTTRERDLAEIVADLATKVFRDQINPQIKQERQWYQVYLSANYHLTHGVKNPVTKWLENLGIFGLRSHEKYIPSVVFQQPVNSIALFLRHLWSTDGCVRTSKNNCHYPSIFYASSSEKLTRDVQSLLLRLGINGVLKIVSQGKKGREQIQVWISEKSDVERFCNIIGAVGLYKQESLLEVQQYLLESGKANTNRDLIPRDVWKKEIKITQQKLKMSNRELQKAMGISYCGSALYKRDISRHRANNIAEILHSETIAKLANSDIYWDKIKTIEYIGEEKVYDLTVPHLCNFSCNLFILHNSIEQDADLVIMLYRDEYYHPDTVDQGVAEVILAKHRNGPTGQVKLIFRSELTQFLNMKHHN